MSEPICYFKRLYSMAYICGGAPVPFEPLDGNQGVIKLDPEKDKAVIECLEKAIAEGRGGITKIAEQEYEDKKKSQPYRPSQLRSQNGVLRVMPSPFQKRQVSTAPEAKLAGRADTAFPDAVTPAQLASDPLQQGQQPLTPAPTPAASAPEPPKLPVAPFKPATRRIGKIIKPATATPASTPVPQP